MEDTRIRYIFPELERKLFVNAGRILFLLELIVHGFCIGLSFYHQNLDGVWVSLFLAAIFGIAHFQNLQLRRYCLAMWSFNGKTFTVYIKEMERSIDITQPFCVATTTLTFARRYSPEKYPFIMIWKPGEFAPYEDMGGYNALKKRDALIIPYSDETLALFQKHLAIKEIPMWPKSSVCFGVSKKQISSVNSNW